MPTPGSSTSPGWAAWRRCPRNRAAVAGLVMVAVFVSMAALGPWLAPRDALKQHLDGALAGPSRAHVFGRDELGRDIFSRVLHGARISLGMALGACLIAAGAGVLVGMVAAWEGRGLEEPLMLLVDVSRALPG